MRVAHSFVVVLLALLCALLPLGLCRIEDHEDPYAAEAEEIERYNSAAALEKTLDASSLPENPDIVELDEKNFEHLTQATTGATTGDWLVKFYAPWCSHCKSLGPIYEQVASELRGVINVARVDCIANRNLGLRFDIKGFPTILLLSKGRMYHFKSERKVETLIDFARGTHKLAEGESIPLPVGGPFTEIIVVLRHAYKEALKDIKARNFLTYNTALIFLPVIFGIIIFLLIVLPVPRPRLPPVAVPRRFPPNPTTVQPTTMRAAPSTSARDAPTSRGGTKND